jgi:hypothetical protein
MHRDNFTFIIIIIIIVFDIILIIVISSRTHFSQMVLGVASYCLLPSAWISDSVPFPFSSVQSEYPHSRALWIYQQMAFAATARPITIATAATNSDNWSK